MSELKSLSELTVLLEKESDFVALKKARAEYKELKTRESLRREQSEAREKLNAQSLLIDSFLDNSIPNEEKRMRDLEEIYGVVLTASFEEIALMEGNSVPQSEETLLRSH